MLPVARHGVGRQGDDWGMNACVLFGSPDPGGGFQAVHLRHLHVHENQVESALAMYVNGFLAAGSKARLMAEFAQQSQR